MNTDAIPPEAIEFVEAALTEAQTFDGVASYARIDEEPATWGVELPDGTRFFLVVQPL